MKRLLIIAAAVIASVLAFEGSNPALAKPDYTQRETVTFTNRTATQATDFHVKFWQKEDNIDVVRWDVQLTSSPGSCIGVRGTQPEPYHSDSGGDNGKHAVDVTCTGLTIAPDASLTLRFEWTLTSFNTKRTYEPTWTYASVPETIAAPNTGWTIGDPKEKPGDPGKFNHKFELCNDDPTQAITVPELKLGSAIPPLLTFAQLGSFTSWDSTDNPGNLTPGQCYSRDVVTVGRLSGGNIVASYKLEDASHNIIMQDLLTHEVPGPVGGIAEAPDVDASALGATDSGGSSSATYAVIAVVAVGLIVLGTGGWYARRRWLS